MAPPKLTSVRLKSRSTLVPFKDDASLIAVRYEKTVQAEPPIPILTRLPRRSLSLKTRRTCASETSTLSSPPTSPIVVTPPPAIDQHPAFRPRLPAAEAAANDWKRDSGLARTTSSSVTIVEECEEEVLTCNKLAPLVVASEVVQQQKLVAPSFCDSESVYSTDEPAVSKQAPSGRCMPAARPTSAAMDHYHFARLQIAEGKISGGFGSTISVDSPLELRDGSMTDLSPAAAPIITPARGSSFTASKKSPNLSPVNIPDDLDLLSKDATDFSPISISIPTVSLLDDDFLTTLSFSNRGSLLFGGRRAFPAQPTDGTMDDKSQPGDSRAHATQAPAAAPAQAALTAASVPETEPAPPVLHTEYEEPPQNTAVNMAEPTTMEATSSEVPSNGAVASDAPTMVSSALSSSAAETNATDTRVPDAKAETMTEATTTATTDANTAEPSTTAETASQTAMKTPSIRVLSADVELESRKVRSLYASGDSINWEDGARPSDVGERLDPTLGSPTDEAENDPYGFLLAQFRAGTGMLTFVSLSH